MEQLGVWIGPILLVPAMALLVISTGNRYSQMLVHLTENGATATLTRQLRLLRRALLLLYLGIASLAVAALLGGLLHADAGMAREVMIVLSCIGIACLVGASTTLVIDVLRDPLA